MNRSLGRTRKAASLLAGAAMLLAGCVPVTPYVEGEDGIEGSKVPAGVTEEGNFPLGPNLTYREGLYTCAGWSQFIGAVAAQRIGFKNGAAECNPLLPGEIADPDETGRSVVANFTEDCAIVSKGSVSLLGDEDMSTSDHFRPQNVDCEFDIGEATGR